MTIKFKDATFDDGLQVLQNLRWQEQKTITKLQLDAPTLLAEALNNGYPSCACFVDGEIAAIFGGSSHTLLGEVSVWMLTTPLIEQHPIAFLRGTRKFVHWMFKMYGPIIGMVDTENEKSRNWLMWIGFRKVRDGEFEVMRYSGGH